MSFQVKKSLSGKSSGLNLINPYWIEGVISYLRLKADSNSETGVELLILSQFSG